MSKQMALASREHWPNSIVQPSASAGQSAIVAQGMSKNEPLWLGLQMPSRHGPPGPHTASESHSDGTPAFTNGKNCRPTPRPAERESRKNVASASRMASHLVGPAPVISVID